VSADRLAALSPSLAANPQLDTWLAIGPDGTVTVRTGKVELGQGILTALARIAADELSVALDRIHMATADTASGPDEAPTVGSLSVRHGGAAIRAAAAEARRAMLARAASVLGVPEDVLEVHDGSLRAPGVARTTSYWELQGGRPFERAITGDAPMRDPETCENAGRPGQRIDLPAKLRGGAFLHDLVFPGMLFACVVRPPRYGATLVDVDAKSVDEMPGVVRVVRDGSFLGVVAAREEQAVAARARLRELARWEGGDALPGHTDVFAALRATPAQSFPVADGTAVDAPVPLHRVPDDAAITLHACYRRPFQMHASIGPSAAIALAEDGALTVWSHTQGVGLLRHALAHALSRPPLQVRVIHAAGPGCYGHNGADDAALDAALIALACPGRHVRLAWMRDDEHVFEPYAPAMEIEMCGSLGPDGGVNDWSHDVYGYTHAGRPLPHRSASGLRAAWERAVPLPRPKTRPRLERHAGLHRNADPLYAFSQKRIVKHLVARSPLRTSSTRGLGAFANVFAIESFMDELAAASAQDPVAFRRRHLDDPRAVEVLRAAADGIGWRTGSGTPGGVGQGIALARYKNSECYAAIAIEASVDEACVIHLHRAVIAADAGRIVDPDGLTNQLEGGMLQAASFTLYEEVRFDRERVTSRDFETYPILRFDQVPDILTVLHDRPRLPSLGAGEATVGPTPAAISNAVCRATGARLRQVPFTPARVREGMRAKR
jgi:CO/xanthine dehydrogenase Mo-binding subunit